MTYRERLNDGEVLSLYAAGRRDFSFTSIVVGYWTGKDLSGINLSGTDLGCGIVSNANLSESYLVGAKFNCVDINGANLRGSDLTNTRFSGNIDCSNVNFTKCCLENVVFTYADLRNSDFLGAYDAGGSIWIKCDLTGANGFEHMLAQSGGIGVWDCIYPNGVKSIGGHGSLFS